MRAVDLFVLSFDSSARLVYSIFFSSSSRLFVRSFVRLRVCLLLLFFSFAFTFTRFFIYIFKNCVMYFSRLMHVKHVNGMYTVAA